MEPSIVKDLRDKNIGIEDEEFYAVACAYIVKIDELLGKKVIIPDGLLKLASKFKVTQNGVDKARLDKAFAEFLEGQDEAVKRVLTSKTNRQKIEGLHNIAMELGKVRDYQESVKRCRQFTDLNEKLEHDKMVYRDSYENYVALSQIKYNDENLENTIKMRAGNVKTPMEAIKTAIMANLNDVEDNFINMQTKFVNKTVSFLVDDRCRIAIPQNAPEFLTEGQVS